jgi:hypothetical protein
MTSLVRKGANIQLIVEAALSMLKRKDDGSVVFIGHGEFVRSSAEIYEQLSLSLELTPTERSRIVTAALIQMIKTGQTTAAQFEHLVREDHSRQLAKPKKRFFLLTSVTSRSKLQVAARRFILNEKVSGVSISIGNAFPTKANIQTWELSGVGKIQVLPKGHYLPLWAKVSARTEAQAAEQALPAINALLASINLFLNFRVQRFRSGRVQPFNEVRLGPDQVVYRSDWSRHEDRIYYEPYFQPPTFPITLEDELPRFEKDLRVVVRKLNDKVFGQFLMEAMQDYQDALTHLEPSLTHAKLWSLLERLTGAPSSGSAKETIRRAIFISRLTDHRRRRLNQAASVRNAYVHRRQHSPFVDEIAEDLRTWVEEMLFWIIFTRRKFKSLDMFFGLLDLPTDLRSLEQRASLIRVAKDILKS